MNRFTFVLFVSFALTATSFAACGNTAGQIVSLDVQVGLYAGPTVQTRAGWEVVLTEARLAIGSIYVLAPAERTARLRELRSVLLPTALAHGGHDDYASLEVRAEWLGETVIDMGQPISIGTADGTAGLAEYTTLDLAMPRDASGPTHGHVAWVHGTATPLAGGDTIEFEGGLDLPDDALSRSVESIASTFDVTGDGTFTLTIDAAPRTDVVSPSWLEDADFARLPGEAGTVRTIAPGTQPYVAWMLAARDSDAFHTSYQARGAR